MSIEVQKDSAAANLFVPPPTRAAPSSASPAPDPAEMAIIHAKIKREQQICGPPRHFYDIPTKRYGTLWNAMER